MRLKLLALWFTMALSGNFLRAQNPASAEPANEFVSEVISVKYALASDIAEAINRRITNALPASSRVREQAAPGMEGIGQVKIIADERSNSLLIFATRPDLERIRNMVAKLDVVMAQ